MPLSEDDYKLAAALVTSLVGSFLGAFLGAQKEKRESYRKLLQKDIKEIGNTTYQSVAIAKTLLNRIKKDQDRASWLTKHKENRVRLESVRMSVRYSMYGCDEGFRSLVRLPTWIALCHKDINICENLIKYGNKIRHAIDCAVIKSFTRGIKPGFISRTKIKIYSFLLKREFNKHMKNK